MYDEVKGHAAAYSADARAYVMAHLLRKKA